MTALKPCPYCGLLPVVAHWANGSAYVRCRQWNVGACVYHGPDRETEAGAIEAWNALMPLNEAEIAALKKDAARYRWLRGGTDVPANSTRWPRWEVRNWDGRYWQTLFAENMDTAVDDAISKETTNVELTGLRRSYGEGPVERRVRPQETNDE